MQMGHCQNSYLHYPTLTAREGILYLYSLPGPPGHGSVSVVGLVYEVLGVRSFQCSPPVLGKKVAPLDLGVRRLPSSK